jgi:RHS repeat-associated protein
LSVKDGSGNSLTSDLGRPISGLGNRYLFQGREYDSATGLYYFRARWYDPVSGRFISKDPKGIGGGLNLYAFCGNNPVNFTDPFGLIMGDPSQVQGSLDWVEGLAAGKERHDEIEQVQANTPAGTEVTFTIVYNGKVDPVIGSQGVIVNSWTKTEMLTVTGTKKNTKPE